ncbi:MAG TPA: ribonuclease R [Caproicibacter sp.]|nr:ribonuclease R [Caproicibacter sp.]
MKDFKEKILHSLQKSPQSLSVRSLLKKMKVVNNSKKAFFAALDELKAEGKVTVSKKKRIHIPRKADTIEATIVSLSRGFAFARPDDGGGDVFIHADKLNNAFVGDRVLLSHVQQSAKGPSADVDVVSEKSSRLITGTFSSENGNNKLLPDIAVRYEIPITRKSALLARNGDKVQAKIRRKIHSSELEAEIVKIYGKAGSAKICADAILDQYGIQAEFSKEALAEAETAASRDITPADLKGRLDLRTLSICTIDGADAKDLDDAISVSKKRNGGFRLGVHIADVSHYIAPDGSLDLEARSRGTSVYFADRVVPMLPKSLSNGVCSLNAGEDKLTFSALIELDKNGNIESYRFRKSVIHSKVRGVYSEVNSLFEGTADRALRHKYTSVIRSLNAARELAIVLRKKFDQNGVVDLESTESVFTLNDEGICVSVRPRRSGEAEQMIECLMITANRAAAKFAKSAGVPFVYRVHEQPNPERIKTLIQLVDAVGLDSKPLKHKDGRIVPSDFADILEQAKGTPAQKVISHQLLRTMAKARYDVNPLGHFGLALEDYCHFTSPIRRYPDTAIHRILTAMLKTKDHEKLRQRFTDFAVEASKMSSDAEIRAMSAERSAEDCYMAEYMTQHIGEVYDGVISGVTQRGVFVELENSVEGFVPMDSFPDSDYRFDGVITQVDVKTGSRLTIGHPLTIKVVSADVASGRIDFVYAGPED